MDYRPDLQNLEEVIDRSYDEQTYLASATYAPEDNKLRIYPYARLDSTTYNMVKGAGYKWAPKQECFVAPMWTPAREDIALALAGQIDDEDTTLLERAEERAERFVDYSGKRNSEAQSAYHGAHAIMDAIPLGQPILVGHHSERRARKDAERIENGLRKAVNLWQTSQYWQERAKGALRHAKYKERPDVRARRIKGLEADLRKQEKNKADALVKMKLWNKEGLTIEQARVIANYCNMTVCETDASRWSAWDVLRPDEERYAGCPSWTVAQVQARVQEVYADYLPVCDRWIAHFQLRLDYERAMLAGDGGTVADQTKPEKGGAVRCWVCRDHHWRGEWLYIRKVNKVSVTVEDNWGNGGANFTRTVPFDALKGVMTAAQVEEKRAAGVLMENTNKTGFICIDMPVKQEVQSHESPQAPFDVAAVQDTLKTGVQVVAVPQLFPTPEALADQVVAEAEIQPGEKVLEPSAGTGRLLEAVLRVPLFAAEPTSAVVAVEHNRELAHALARRSLPRCRVEVGDFLTLTPEEYGLFDAVVMNPPFENGLDIAHVVHALDFLRPGGRLVAIMSAGVTFREDRRTATFRRLIDTYGGTITPLPDGTFSNEGTGVRTVLVAVHTPATH